VFPSKIKFTKPPIGFDEQIALLERRGIRITDLERAKQALKVIGYYRLSGYFRYFTKPDDAAREHLKSAASFDDVVALYVFERRMRALLMDAR